MTFVPLTDPIKRSMAKKITPGERKNISLGSTFLRFFISHLILEKKEENELAILAFIYDVKMLSFLEKRMVSFSEMNR